MATSALELDKESEQFIESEIERRLYPKVREEVAKEEERRFRQIKWIVAFVGIVGLGTFGTLSNYLIEKAVETRIKDKVGDIDEALDFVNFSAVSLKLELGESFSPDDLELIMTYLRKAKDNNEVRHSRKFIAALYQITRSFASASKSAAIDEIFAMYEPEILTSPLLIEALLHHYGQAIVGRGEVPNPDIDFQNFEKLEKVAASSNVEELGLAYRTLYEAKCASSANVESHIKRALGLRTSDLQRYLNEIFLRSKCENWMKTATPQGIEIRTVVLQFCSQYAPALADTFGTESALFEEIAKEGIDRDESQIVAIQLASAYAESQ